MTTPQSRVRVSATRNSTTISVHYPTVDSVEDLYPDAGQRQTVLVTIGGMTLFFANRVAAHDFATEIHSGIEKLPGFGDSRGN